jgi:hypothetical protein
MLGLKNGSMLHGSTAGRWRPRFRAAFSSKAGHCLRLLTDAALSSAVSAENIRLTLSSPVAALMFVSSMGDHRELITTSSSEATASIVRNWFIPAIPAYFLNYTQLLPCLDLRKDAE